MTGTQPDQVQPEQPQPGNGGSTDPRVMNPRGTDARGTGPGTENSTQPLLPEDVSKWSKADLVRARMENNPKLLEAVIYLSEKNPGSVPVAQQLADLLKTPKPPETSGAYPTPTTYSSIPGLIEATIFALGKNGSQAARQTLMQVLNGKFTTDDDRTAVEAVLKTLIQIPSAENDDILLKVLLSPEEIRPLTLTQQGSFQPTELRSRALELIKQSVSENLSIKLAQESGAKRYGAERSRGGVFIAG